MVPLRWRRRRWRRSPSSNGVGEEGREDEGDALKGEGEGEGVVVVVAAVLLRLPFPVPAKPRVDRTRRTRVAGRDEFDATLFLLAALGFFLLPDNEMAAVSAELKILHHDDLLAVGGVGSGLM